MLEHADRDDPVEGPGLLAVVAQLEPDPVGQALAAGALPADLELLLGQRDPEHLAGAGLGERQREPAPARADVEHPHARPQQQLGREVALLVRLRLLEVGVRMGEVGAAVLPVAVQEQIVQPVRQIVVMGDVGLGPAAPDCTGADGAAGLRPMPSARPSALSSTCSLLAVQMSRSSYSEPCSIVSVPSM